MPKPVQALLVLFVLFVLTMKPVFLWMTLAALALVFISGWQSLWPRR